MNQFIKASVAVVGFTLLVWLLGYLIVSFIQWDLTVGDPTFCRIMLVGIFLLFAGCAIETRGK